MAISPEKEKALAAAMTQIDRKFGKGSIMKMGESNPRFAIEVIPTGAIALDIALGVGGLPRGRVIEIYRPGEQRQDDAGPAYYRRGPEDGRPLPRSSTPSTPSTRSTPSAAA